MVAVKQLELHQLLESGIQKSLQLGSPILACFVTQVDYIDPLSFFHNGEKMYRGLRTFWKDTRGNHIVGVGSALKIEGTKKARVNQVEKAWNSYLESAVIEGAMEQATGPILMGGFSFDPLKDKDDLWNDYPDAGFMVPKFMLTDRNGKTFITVNSLVNQNVDPKILADHLFEEKEMLLHYKPVNMESKTSSLTLKEIGPSQWLDAVRSMAAEIQSSKLGKVVLARHITVEAEQAFLPTRVLHNLCEQQKDSFIFAFERGGSCFIGATPERLVKKEGRTFYSMCLAGSIKRGATPEEDEKLGLALLNDHKNLTEHEHVVDMIASSMDKVCSEIEVPDGPSLYKLSDIQHLYTPVIGRTNDDTSLLSVVYQLHPTPALGGVPRNIAMEKIRLWEPQDRGWYASPIGWMDYRGDGEFAVAIRSGLIQKNKAVLFAGCGIVKDSEPTSEYEETNIKFRPMLKALGGEQM